MVNLFVNYYNSSSINRNLEIINCLHMNIDNNNIDKMYVIRSSNDDPNIISDKISTIINDDRPTFRYFFDVINNNTGDDDVNIILNSDCFLNENFIQIINNMKKQECYVLNRFEVDDISNLHNYYRGVSIHNSQDGWVFKGKIDVIGGDFQLGIPGCDNRICYDIHISNYNIINPLESGIFVYHLHKSQYRTYSRGDIIPKPYALIYPSVINIPSRIEIE